MTRIYTVRERGVSVRLHVGDTSIVAVAQAGRLMRPVRISAPHAGVLRDAERPHEQSLAKSLVREAADKVLGVKRQNPFDALVDDLHREMQRSERPMRKAFVILRKLAGSSKGTVLVFKRSSTLRVSSRKEK